MPQPEAAGDCAVPVRGRVLLKAFDGEIICMCFLMDLATPSIPPTGRAGLDPPPALGLVLPPSRRCDMVHQMIRLVQRLHANKRIMHGNLKLENMVLLDDHDHDQGQGQQLWLCDFAKGRFLTERTRASGNGEFAGNDEGLKERQRRGVTIDVDEVDDPEALITFRPKGFCTSSGYWHTDFGVYGSIEANEGCRDNNKVPSMNWLYMDWGNKSGHLCFDN
ncbi:hypothetical protein N657DRAFT_691036 [Parathielavia appendiculata]|uniref:Protein kinase domain-containing protein n=1 Tax=Parathielavia appendiculata TaxID=2587402 RepID=A0AAN6TYB3_9PEZI|nr:hypothetical protein N657DRAFT_691036 [Parathielavia appendiculata]